MFTENKDPVMGDKAAAARTHGTAGAGAGCAADGAARDGGRTRGTRPRRRASPAPPACRPLCHRAIYPTLTRTSAKNFRKLFYFYALLVLFKVQNLLFLYF